MHGEEKKQNHTECSVKIREGRTRERWMVQEKIYHANQKKVVVTILISDYADFRTRKVFRTKEEDDRMIKSSILQEDIAILNMDS